MHWFCVCNAASDEANRIFARQDAQWDKERAAREALMRQVLGERQQQIEEQLERVRAEQVHDYWILTAHIEG